MIQRLVRCEDEGVLLGLCRSAAARCRPTAPPPPASAQVPVVSLAVPEAEAARVLRQACLEDGFFYLVSHGVGEDLIASAVDAQRRFFSLPLEHKMSIAADSNYRRVGVLVSGWGRGWGWECGKPTPGACRLSPSLHPTP